MEDVEKRRERQRRYRQTEKYKENRRKYTQTEQYKKKAREYAREWRKKNPQKVLEMQRRQMKRLRLRVFEYLGGAECKRCGCTLMGALQINHVNFGGHKELEKKAYPTFLRNIIKHKRKDEFEVLCGVCNVAHYFEEKFGLKYQIHCATVAPKDRALAL